MMDIIRKAAEAAIISLVVLVFMIAGTDMASALTWSEVQAKLNSVDPTVLIEYGQNEPHGIIAGANDGPLVVKKGKEAIIELAGPIDRNLASPKENGYVIRIEGECFIKGGRYDSGFNNFIKGGNNTGNGGGIYVAKGGVLILDTYVKDNKARNGGGVYVADGGTLILNRYSNSSGNGAGYIFDNIAERDGGGIYVEKGGTVIQNGGELSGNRCESKSGVGCGAYVRGTYEMNRGTISNHQSNRDGAGITVDEDGEFIMTGGGIYNNSTGRIEGDGAGVLVQRYGSMKMTGGSIFQNTSNGCGAGICVKWGGTLEMTGGTVSLNECRSIVSESGGFVLEMGEVKGAGIFMEDGNVTLSGAPVIKNNLSKKKDGTYQDNLFIYDGKISISDKLEENADVNVRTLKYPDDQVVTTGLPRNASPSQIVCDLPEYTTVTSGQEGCEGEAEFVKKEGLVTHTVRLLDDKRNEIAPRQIVKDGGKAVRIHPINGYYTIWYDSLPVDDPYDFGRPVTSDLDIFAISEPRKKFTVKYVTGIDDLVLEDREGVSWLDSIYPAEHGNEEALFSEHGKVFGGWFTDPEFTHKYSGGSYGETAKTDTVTELTLYAKFGHMHDGQDFFAWKKADSLPDEPGNYYLDTDVTLPCDEERWQFEKGEYRICLNGHTIRRDDDTGNEYYINDSVLQVNFDATLYIYDEPEKNGKITGGRSDYNGGGIRLLGTIKMYGGEISGNFAKNGGGIGIEANGHLVMHGGSITGNECDSQGAGGGVYVEYMEWHEKYMDWITRITLGGGGVSPVKIAENKSGTNKSDVSLPGGSIAKYIEIDGMLDSGTEVGVSVRSRLEKKGDKVRVTSGFDGNADNREVVIFAEDIGSNGLPYDICEEKVNGVMEKFLMYGIGGSDNIKKNPMTVRAKKLTVKYRNVKKKSRRYKVKKYLTIRKAKGRVTYKKVKGNKRITINKKTGKLTVKKGIKKGRYTIRVRVSAKGTRTYLPAKKTVKVTVRVR